jgi:hypothetical protein
MVALQSLVSKSRQERFTLPNQVTLRSAVGDATTKTIEP